MGLWKRVVAFIFPTFCLECGRLGELLCERCWTRVVFVYEQGCPVCYEPSIGGLTHPGCRTPWGMDGLWCITFYQGPIRKLVRQLKYHQATVVAGLIGALVEEYTHHEQLYIRPGVMLPIPLHVEAQRRRGFNQAQLIADQLGQSLDLPVVSGVVKRVEKRLSQTRLNKAERKANMQGIFAIDLQKEQAAEVIKDQTFIVVDDVFTSGATMAEMAKVLKRAGAARVYGLALARD